MKFIKKFLEDFLIICGLILVITATFLLNFVAGIYVTGFILFGLGCYFSRYPLK